MPDLTHHVAQINIARARFPLDDPRMADFTDNLARINGLGAETPGFVWQLINEDGNSTSFSVFGDAANIVNYTVWKTIDALYDFAYKSEHVEYFRRRREWLEPIPGIPALALWWIPAGHIPTLEEAETRLLHLRDHGPTPLAFSFKQRYTVDEMLAQESS
jgi:hypothetical protein